MELTNSRKQHFILHQLITKSVWSSDIINQTGYGDASYLVILGDGLEQFRAMKNEGAGLLQLKPTYSQAYKTF